MRGVRLGAVGATYAWRMGDVEAKVWEIQPVEIHKSPSPQPDLEIQLETKPCGLK